MNEDDRARLITAAERAHVAPGPWTMTSLTEQREAWIAAVMKEAGLGV